VVEPPQLANKTLLAVLFAVSVLFASCGGSTTDDDDDDDGGGQTIKLDFQAKDYGGFIYKVTGNNPMTDPDNADSITAVKAGDGATLPACLKISGKLQKDFYGTALEIGIRLQVAKALAVSNVNLLGKVVAVRAYVAENAVNTGLQLIVQDSGDQQSMGQAQELTAGQWTTVYFKLVDASVEQKSFTSCDAQGNNLGAGAYTSSTFDPDKITEFEIRSVGNNSSNADEEVAVWIDYIEWANVDINANLKTLTLSADSTDIPLSFAANKTAYEVEVPETTASIEFAGTADAAGATVAFNPASPITVDANTTFPITITATVTAKDGKTKKNYTIKVSKAGEPGVLDPTNFKEWYGATVTDNVISFTTGGVYYEWPTGFNKDDWDTFTIQYEILSTVDNSTNLRKIALKSWVDTSTYADFEYPQFNSATGSITLKDGEDWYGGTATKTLYTDMFTKKPDAIGFAITTNGSDDDQKIFEMKIISLKFSNSN
jgi:hypothetical protein